MPKKPRKQSRQELPEEEIELVSKTQMKREMQALQELGTKLMKLSHNQLDKLDLDTTLRAAVDEAKRLKSGEAVRRQMQYIGRLMRDQDPDELRAAVEQYEAGTQAHTAIFHKLERWRDRLIEGGNEALQAYIAEMPNADVQHLRQLVRNAKKEAEQNKGPAASRKLFKYLRELAEI